MKRPTALQIDRYLDIRSRDTVGEFKIRRKAFQNWEQKSLITADIIERNDGMSLVCLLVDWRDQRDWYLVACHPTSLQPLVEIRHEERIGSIDSLVWKYRPSKRDNRNDERRRYFRTQVGDLMMRFTIPAPEHTSPEFLVDLFVAVESRKKADALDPSEPDALESFPEGDVFERLHTSRERNSVLIKLVKATAIKKGALACQICAFDFQRQYGIVGHGYIEVHHTVPVSELAKGHRTRPEDLALVCANCHRMLHRHRPWLTMEQLVKVLSPTVE